MNEKAKMTTRESTQTQDSGNEAYALRPAVNIFEEADGITVEADMPGVSKDRLEIQVDRDSLLIEGDMKLDLPEGMEALYADVRSTRYSRSFALSSELNVDGVDATLKDGVLRLRIPKREEVRPRKVAVRTD